jgi:hypothetical protein
MSLKATHHRLNESQKSQNTKKSLYNVVFKHRRFRILNVHIIRFGTVTPNRWEIISPPYTISELVPSSQTSPIAV